MRGLLIAIALAGCKDDNLQPACKEMADHVLDIMAPADDHARAIRDAFATRCTEDRWTTSMRGCVLGTTSLAEPKSCKRFLEPDQVTKLDAAIQEADRQAARRLPQACHDYQQLVAAAQHCSELPQDIRTDLAKRLADHEKSWETMDDKTSLEPMCSAGISALRQTAPNCFR